MEGHFAFDFEKCDPGDSQAGGEKMVKGCKTGIGARRKLADISNVQQQSKLMNRDSKQHPALPMSNDHVDKLYKENMILMKVVSETNKVIESHGLELQKLRVNLQKVQQQNSQLAQANSQMRAELNSGKGKLRVLQHELGCINGLLIKARKPETEVEAANEFQPVEYSSLDKAEKGSSLDNSDLDIEKVEDRRASRRQSARFMAEEPGPTQELFQIDEANPEKVNCSSLQESALGKEEKAGDIAIKLDIQENRRSFVGRPSRRAVQKVQSYAEIPLNAKMRRRDK